MPLRRLPLQSLVPNHIVAAQHWLLLFHQLSLFLFFSPRLHSSHHVVLHLDGIWPMLMGLVGSWCCRLESFLQFVSIAFRFFFLLFFFNSSWWRWTVHNVAFSFPFAFAYSFHVILKFFASFCRACENCEKFWLLAVMSLNWSFPITTHNFPTLISYWLECIMMTKNNTPKPRWGASRVQEARPTTP